ncbi:energy-coupling factor transporter transmembrane component T family protein [Protaetiibacter intestinalis]|uniref:Energy-coupling factor transporter transmembrane protein EcfT n=1 Tax=Protaetiibacter intestinalis TaxID=2419774 RepID=A0A387B6C1_9MICO|nr:energy-coupling factor transporter transmembrane component T [Protaetiibacter intestinalis]AYF97301.1 energy-coupling factor transporter transmembrane protein EcfT [Protaetiibacter intestinalis]
MTAVVDPYAAAARVSAVRFLHGLNPLVKLAAPLPAIVALVFSRDLATPLAFAALGYALLLVGARLTARSAALLFLAIPLTALVLSLSFGLWIDGSRVDDAVVLLAVGDYRFTLGMWQVGAATALRLAAIVVLSLTAGLTTTGPDVARSLVQQLRVPYRVGYTALAAFRFVPRFAHELEVIRQAHRVRGMTGGRGPIAAVHRWFGYAVPLLAGAIRHAERVALAMDSRAFGAHRTRTERHLVPFRLRDIAYLILVPAATAALLLTIPTLELP